MRMTRGISILGLLLLAIGLMGGRAGLIQQAEASEDALEASYQLVSSEDLEDGSFRATLSLTFSNTGDRDFEDLSVKLLISPTHHLAHWDQTLAVGQLWMTETVSLTSEVLFYSPVDGERGLLLIAEGREADGLGNPSVFLIEAEAAQ